MSSDKPPFRNYNMFKNQGNNIKHNQYHELIKTRNKFELYMIYLLFHIPLDKHFHYFVLWMNKLRYQSHKVNLRKKMHQVNNIQRPD